MEGRLTFITSLIREAGERIIELRKSDFDVSSKDNDARDVLTSVDLAINKLILERINTDYPGEIILSEENENNLETASSYWTTDPIDGTANFARNIPHYAVVVAFVENGEPVVGAVYNPITKELFSFEKGKGAFLNGNALLVSAISNIKDAYVLLHIGRKENIQEWGLRMQKFLLSNAKKNINLASSALDLCFLASGRVDAVMYGTMTTRDIAVAIGIVREAGGEVYDEKGNKVVLSGEAQKVYATANKALLDELIKV